MRDLLKEEVDAVRQDSVEHHQGDSGVADNALDTMFVVGRMLGEYICTVASSRNMRVHLVRDGGLGPVNFTYDPAIPQPWYEFQIDRGNAALFSPVPLARRVRLLKQIVLLKTFWDISSGLRARRLWRLVNTSDVKKASEAATAKG